MSVCIRIYHYSCNEIIYCDPLCGDSHKGIMSPGLWGHVYNGISRTRLYYEYAEVSWSFCDFYWFTWWCHQMAKFSASLAICAGNSPVPGEFPAQRPWTRSFDVFFDLGPNKWLSKQWWGWWFETPSNPLSRHCNDASVLSLLKRDFWVGHAEFKA